MSLCVKVLLLHTYNSKKIVIVGHKRNTQSTANMICITSLLYMNFKFILSKCTSLKCFIFTDTNVMCCPWEKQQLNIQRELAYEPKMFKIQNLQLM